MGEKKSAINIDMYEKAQNFLIFCSFYLRHLPPPQREARVAAQPPLQVVRALPVSTQVDGARLDVDVHQVVDDFTLNVILDLVDQEAAAHVYDLDEGELPAGGWNRLVCLEVCFSYRKY